jgi:hypothetical protein
MNKIIILVCLMFPTVCFSQQATYNQSCSQVTISSSTPVEITGNLANQRKFAWDVKVSNLDASSNLACSQDSAVSCSSGAHHGEIVAASPSAPYNFLSWLIATIQGWYCISCSSSGSTLAQICLTYGVK